ncbi:hypothetical protein O6H91_19G040400 [Diphasiastrum complanatum]|uniref:Uncharacterized protein n=1 Tax=Diphasiastrum complanatum TaxID=34168 RepID=A0ACC2AUL2_DIPCM|nr:hypothetical protein O6H91_19G040400 [Diphasiastrum complanatum]
MAYAGDVLLPQGSFRDGQFWDEFFEARKGRPFEWYVEWEHLSLLLAHHCGLLPSMAPQSQILVPGCGNSELSAQMYDAGFHHITNIDFCQAVIREMLHKHARSRPRMMWRVMDMTNMQFPGKSFDVVMDKGGLDALLGEPEEDPTTGRLFLSEVRRVLKPGGRYACVTLAQKHVIDILMSNFRCGWSLDVHEIPASRGSSPSSLSPFLVIIRSMGSSIVPSVNFFLDEGACHGYKEQLRSLEETIEEENRLRLEDKHESNGLCHLCNLSNERDLVTETPNDFKKLQPGRRATILLGGSGQSQSAYRAIMLDAQDSGRPVYQCAVFLIPKGKAHEWLFSSEEGQWKVLESAKTGRLIMVFLDVNYLGSTSDIQDELSLLLKDFLPASCQGHHSVPYLMSDDGIRKRTLLEEIDSSMTGRMFVEDVVLSKEESLGIKSKEQAFRRLIFKRNPNLIQSEALLNVERMTLKEYARGKGKETSHRCAKKRITKVEKDAKQEELKVDHSYLASPYHGGMVAGLSLIASKIEKWLLSKEKIGVMVIGLGAGLLPMFIYKHLPVHNIQVVEIDPVVGDLAKRHFAFVEDKRMQLQLGDGVAVVQALADLNHISSAGSCLHILLIDVDSSDSSKGLSCPPSEFFEEPFLQASKKALVEGGMIAINFVSRVTACYELAVVKLCEVFQEVYDLKIDDEDVNRVLFALPQASNFSENLSEISTATENLCRMCSKFSSWDHGPDLSYLLRTLKRLK